MIAEHEGLTFDEVRDEAWREVQAENEQPSKQLDQDREKDFYG